MQSLFGHGRFLSLFCDWHHLAEVGVFESCANGAMFFGRWGSEARLRRLFEIGIGPDHDGIVVVFGQSRIYGFVGVSVRRGKQVTLRQRLVGCPAWCPKLQAKVVVQFYKLLHFGICGGFAIKLGLLELLGNLPKGCREGRILLRRVVVGIGRTVIANAI